MRIDVYNREQAEALEPRHNAVVISITTPGNPVAALKQGWADVYRLAFHDFTTWVGDEIKPGKPVVYFTHEDAADLRDWIEKRKEFDFVIHCDAGVSRSVAVGVYLRDVYEGELTTHAIHTTIGANSLVRALMMRSHWVERFKQ